MACLVYEISNSIKSKITNALLGKKVIYSYHDSYQISHPSFTQYNRLDMNNILLIHLMILSNTCDYIYVIFEI